MQENWDVSCSGDSHDGGKDGYVEDYDPFQQTSDSTDIEMDTNHDLKNLTGDDDMDSISIWLMTINFSTMQQNGFHACNLPFTYSK